MEEGTISDLVKYYIDTFSDRYIGHRVYMLSGRKGTNFATDLIAYTENNEIIYSHYTNKIDETHYFKGKADVITFYYSHEDEEDLQPRLSNLIKYNPSYTDEKIKEFISLNK